MVERRGLLGGLLGGLVGRAAWRMGFVRDPGDGGVRLHWPSGGGDWGPPGWWQMYGRSQMPSELTSFSAVYACATIISQDIGKLPLQVFRTDPKTGVRVQQRNDYYERLMVEPNSYQTGVDFMQLFVMSYLLQGNAYAYAKRNGRGEVCEMHVLDPRKTQPYIDETGEIFYRVGTNLLAQLPGGAVIPERDIIHHRLPLMPGFPLVGVTPIYAAAASSGVGLSILNNSHSFFRNSSRPSGVLKAPGKVSKETSDRLATDWDNNYSNQRYGKTAVLPEGLAWEPLTITATDAQLIEQLRWSVEDVGRVFRVPPFMLGDVSKTTYRNSEQLARAYLSGCLSWHIEALEARFGRAFDFPFDYSMVFDLATLLRAEIDVRFKAYQEALAAAWITPNEVRASEGLPPVEGGDEPHIQSQYVPLSMSGLVPAQPAPGAPAPAPQPGDEPKPSDEPQEPDPSENAPGAAIDPALVRRLVRARLTQQGALL
jgi:HK97 family phage portal protein